MGLFLVSGGRKMWKLVICCRRRNQTKGRKAQRGGWTCDLIKGVHPQLKLTKGRQKRQAKRLCHAWLWMHVFTMFHTNTSLSPGKFFPGDLYACVNKQLFSGGNLEGKKKRHKEDLSKENSAQGTKSSLSNLQAVCGPGWLCTWPNTNS